MTDAVQQTEAQRLGGLRGNNPLGYLAALGTLVVVSRFHSAARLGWCKGLVPHAYLSGVTEHEVVAAVLRDAKDCLASAVLAWPRDKPHADLKVPAEELSRWAQAAAREERWVSDLWCGLLAEGALDNNGMSKPTHLHFTAGQQRFLTMARELGIALDEERIREAGFGPWRYDSVLPSLSLDARGERIYALRGRDPAKEVRLGVPGADWLAFRGLAMFPTRRAASGKLETTACDPAWKASAFRWPVWERGTSAEVTRALVADSDLVGSRTQRAGTRHRRVPTVLDSSALTLRERGVFRVYEARISRSDQGGYGSFSPAEMLADSG